MHAKRGWRRRWYPTPLLLPGKFHGRRSLVGCSPWGCIELDTTERLHFDFSLSYIGEGNGNPLQCSCLENPRDGGAWWLPSMGSHRVGHDWSDLAAAAAAKRGTLVCPKAALSWCTLLCFPLPPGAPPCHLWTLVCPQNIHTRGRTLAIYGKGHPNLLLTSCRTLDKSSCAHGLKYQKNQGWNFHCKVSSGDLSSASVCKMPVIPVLCYLYHSCCEDEGVNVDKELWLLHESIENLLCYHQHFICVEAALKWHLLLSFKCQQRLL